MGPTVPNTAVPSPVTKEEGKVFAELCRICREIESENHQNNYFKYYNEITPMTTTVCQEMLTYKYSHHNCGTGSSMLGFLPDGMISTCHAGFSHFIDEYKKAAASSNRVNTSTITFDDFVAEQPIKFCVDEKGFEEFERHMSLFNTEGTTARVGMLTNIIMSLALAGQIDEAFIDEKNALIGAIYIQTHGSFCIKDNFNKTGSITLTPIGVIKLLLNGAMPYTQMEEELHVECTREC